MGRLRKLMEEARNGKKGKVELACAVITFHSHTP